jgi:hypothetical protein
VQAANGKWGVGFFGEEGVDHREKTGIEQCLPIADGGNAETKKDQDLVQCLALVINLGEGQPCERRQPRGRR